LDTLLESYDAVIGAGCGVVAPIGLTATGSSDFIRLWTTFGLPQANIPLLSQPGGLPIGLQVVGACRNDALVLRLVEWIAARLPGLAQPYSTHETPSRLDCQSPVKASIT
jgi:Asp-tRNA(Asn)/Glu-tRNA(Gln) amidotransferase A subunit family amidase